MPARGLRSSLGLAVLGLSQGEPVYHLASDRLRLGGFPGLSWFVGLIRARLGNGLEGDARDGGGEEQGLKMRVRQNRFTMPGICLLL